MISSGKIKFTADYKRNYVAFMAVLLFFLIIAGEILLAVAIPLLMRNENLMRDEANRLDLLQQFDSARILCSRIGSKNQSGSDDNILLQEKQLLTDALDSFARYMRNEGQNLTPGEVQKISAAVTELHKIAANLYKNGKYSRENRLDTSKYINSLLKQSSGEIKNGGK